VGCIDELDPATLGEIPWLDARHEHPNDAKGHKVKRFLIAMVRLE
jgi:hypothetical protein